MAGQHFDTVTKSGKAHAKMSHQNQRRGPGGKNLQSSRRNQAHPAPSIRSTGQQVKGPDKGAGQGG